MSYDLEQRVESLIAELEQCPISALNESQTRRSEIFEEILRMVALSLELTQRAQSSAEHGRWV
jgi:hypothetical protein